MNLNILKIKAGKGTAKVMTFNNRNEISKR